MRRDLPSLTSLEAFAAAARHRSFTRAALDLHVTQGAVSRQVQLLEEQLGVALFDRVRKRISLSAAGEAYLPKVRACLERLEAATLQIKAFKGALSAAWPQPKNDGGGAALSRVESSESRVFLLALRARGSGSLDLRA